MTESFVHLHVHTDYSMLDGATRLDDLVATAEKDGQPAVAVTDHGVLFGLVDFYKAAIQTSVKPILGTELYQAHGSRFDKERTPKWTDADTGDDEGNARYYHLSVLAQNDVGYHNLVKLSTDTYTDGYWYKPRADRELLAKYSDGLIILSGCLGGEVIQTMESKGMDAAKAIASEMKDIFGPERYFIELMDHGIPAQKRTFPKLQALAKDLGLRTVITNDSHYTDASEAEAHDILLCIGTQSKVKETNRFRFSGPNYYFRTAEEMWQQYGSLAPDALRTTLDIAEMVDTKLEFDLDLLPKFPVPDGETESTALRRMVQEGAVRRYGTPIPSVVQERIDYELDVIDSMGFPAYFLIVADLCDYARRVGIRVGPGRGSAGGSVVAYCTEITQVDPIRHGLIFERFLNPSRNEMPDIDMDFDDRRRGEMIRYAADRYGDDHVAQIITFGTIKAKSAMRDAARVLDEPFAVGDNLAKMMPPAQQGKDWPLVSKKGGRTAYDLSSELRDAKQDPTYRKVLQTAESLEGLKRQHGIHAAAVIIGASPLSEVVPLMRTDKGETVTQYEMKACEALGLLKMDFLGLRNLTVLSDAERHVRDNRGVEVDLDDQELLGEMADPVVYEMLATGDTLGVFQLDSAGMQALVRKLKPSRFEDISALLALYRPGPLSMDMHLTYADRKNGLEDVEFDHPDLEPILGDTYGVCVAGETVVTDVQTGQRIRVDQAEGRTFLVQGADGREGKVTHWVDNGEKETIRLRVQSGRSVRLTPEHRVLTPDGWREAGSLTEGDMVAVPHRLRVEGEHRNADRLRVLGYLIGDGSVSSRSNIVFVNCDPALLDDFERRLHRGFDDCAVKRRNHAGVVRLGVHDDGSGRYLRTSSLLSFLREQNVQGRDSESKHVPDYVLGADDDGIVEFLAAYWDCDGHVGKKFAFVKTISPRLAEEVQELLLRLGIPSRLGVYPQADCRNGVAYAVHVYDAKRFARIQSRMMSWKRDVSFAARESGGWFDRHGLLDALAPIPLPQKEIARIAGVSSKSLFQSGRRWTKGRIAQALNREFDLGLDQSNRWEPVVAVVESGRTRVYDLTVEATHSFVADGIVVHNCVYQEQVMQIATDLAGFSMADADGLRKAVGKKKRELMESFKGQFVDGGAANDYDRSLMSDLWDLIEKFAEYGFNKAHTVAYGVISYQTAWLKAHYPQEYMAALLTSVKNNKDMKPIYLGECRRMGIEVLPPDVNSSQRDFAPVGEDIRFGMSAVRGVGDAVVDLIVEARREHGEFTDFRDFCDKVDAGVLNKRTLENLAKAGAFRSLGHTRKGLLGAFEQLVDAALAIKKAEAAGQDSLFDMFGADADDGPALDDGVEIHHAEFGKQQLLALEREMLGLYVSDHPLFGTERLLGDMTDRTISGLREAGDGARVKVGGVLTALSKRFTKNGDTYLRATLEDLTGSVECVFWASTYRVAHEVLDEDAVLVADARVEIRDEAVSLTVDKVSAPDLTEVRGTPLTITFGAQQCTATAVTRLREILGHHRGYVPVHVEVAGVNGVDARTFRLPDEFRVDRASGLYGELKSAFGPDAVVEPGGTKTYGEDRPARSWEK